MRTIITKGVLVLSIHHQNSLKKVAFSGMLAFATISAPFLTASVYAASNPNSVQADFNSMLPNSAKTALSQALSNVPFTMPKMSIPKFSNKQFDIVNYGAVSNSYVVNTIAINDAIAAASKAGGGEVVIPSGMWITGPIVLQSNVNLHIDAGALVQFTGNHDAYPLLPSGSKYVVQSPISSTNATNVAITGRGVFDGAGNTWRPVKKEKLSSSQWSALIASGGVVSSDGSMWWPTVQGMNAEAYTKSHSMKTETDYENIKDYLRPIMVSFIGDKNVMIDGPTFKNSPSHTVKINSSTNVLIFNTKISNPWYSQNTDGFDISADNNVVMNEDTINTGDDGIALESSGSDNGTFKVQNIIIDNVHVYNGHSGFAVGSDTDGGVRNVYVHQLVCDGTEDGLRFKSGAGKGGMVKDVFINGVVMRDIQGYGITFNDGYVDNGADVSSLGASGSSSMIPEFEQISFSNIAGDDVNQAIRMMGLPNAPIQDISLAHVFMRSDIGVVEQYTQNITNSDVNIVTDIHELGEIPHF